ncbi:cytochrome p450 9e2 [Lasius niger]|uniref:Cytochrome p450 9e2 n=1 Tax=Lasius niger TaxID=67767 RepID=A0A0J7JYM6_LASNI|nr:cytochrome p450 9e2 [Lasius niger]
MQVQVPDPKPYLVKAGAIIWIQFYGLQYDPKYFPEELKLVRFLDENRRSECNLNAYYPFGLGLRMCIGNRFELLETKIMPFHLLTHCDLKPCKKTSIPSKLKKSVVSIFSMQTEGSLWLSVVPRGNSHSTQPIINTN